MVHFGQDISRQDVSGAVSLRLMGTGRDDGPFCQGVFQMIFDGFSLALSGHDAQVCIKIHIHSHA